MNLIHPITRPYFVYRPSQIWRRLQFELRKPSEPRWVRLPWKLEMWAKPHDDIGHSLQTVGINDLIVSECLFRLTDPGELAVDVGANVGYTTSILSVRVGPSGRVVSFEPHPSIYQEICANLEKWKALRTDLPEIKLVNHAVSDRAGEAVLNQPASFDTNSGRATLQAQDGTEEKGLAFCVATVSLDSQFNSGETIGQDLRTES